MTTTRSPDVASAPTRVLLIDDDAELAELDVSHREFMRAAAAVPEPAFAPNGAARELFVGVGPGHYREHATQIQQWRRTESA